MGDDTRVFIGWAVYCQVWLIHFPGKSHVGVYCHVLRLVHERDTVTLEEFWIMYEYNSEMYIYT